MRIFQNTQKPPVSYRQVLTRYQSARMNLLLMIGFTLINLIFLVSGSDTYVLFSASIPYFVISLGMILCGRAPEEVYTEAEELAVLPEGAYLYFIIAAVVILAMYGVFWFFSRNGKYPWLIAGAVFFFVDSSALIAFSDWKEVILDLFFHVWVLYYLVMGVFAGVKMKKFSTENESNGPNPEEQNPSPPPSPF